MFPKIGVPQIIYFKWMFHCKPSSYWGSVGISRVTGCHYRCRTKVRGGKKHILGYPHVRNPPNGYHRVEVLGAHHGTLVH